MGHFVSSPREGRKETEETVEKMKEEQERKRNRNDSEETDGWMDGYFVYRRSTLKGHIASNKLYII